MNANDNILIFPYHEKGGAAVTWEGRESMLNRKIEQVRFMRISFPELELDRLPRIGCWPSVAEDAYSLLPLNVVDSQLDVLWFDYFAF
jgi:hypothetical protein